MPLPIQKHAHVTDSRVVSSAYKKTALAAGKP